MINLPVPFISGCKEKIILTGNPVRQDLKDLKSKREEAHDYFKLDKGKKTILVIGGSLGARTINEAMAAGLQTLVDNRIQLIWQTGKSYYIKASQEATKFSDDDIFAFLCA